MKTASPLTKVRGLKFPDEYLIKYFFKQGFHQKPGRVLELGCGNGNNLSLFYAYGWRTVGVDFSADALADAAFNLDLMTGDEPNYQFLRHDLSKGMPRAVRGTFDVVLIPNVLNYLRRSEATALLKSLRKHTRSGSGLFVRTRSIRDYRYARGTRVENDSFRMTTDETGEQGLINTCYREFELVDLVRDHVAVSAASLQVFCVDAQNLQGGLSILNSDIVLWGNVQ